jgi:capsular polysaccharide biosynthesis protein
MTQHILIANTQFHKAIYYLKRKKKAIFLTGLLFFLSYCCFYFFHPTLYESSAIIYTSNPEKKEKNNATVQDEDESYLIINWVYSSVLIDHLIKQFNLIEHYGFQNHGEEKYAECFNEISDNISTKSTSYGAIKLSVKDNDRHTAANIANEILKQIHQLNIKSIITIHKKTIAEYDNIFKELSVAVKTERDSISHILSFLNKLAETNGKNSEVLESTTQSLLQTSYNYERLSSEWLNAKRKHLTSLKLIEKNGMPSYVIVKYALPPARISFFSFSNILSCFLSFFSGVFVAILSFLFYQNYSQHIKFLITEPYQNEEESPKVYPINKTDKNQSQDDTDTYVASDKKYSSQDN